MGKKVPKCDSCGTTENIAYDDKGLCMGLCWHCVTGDSEFAEEMANE